MKKNFALLWARDGLNAASAAFASASVIQAFMLQRGCSETQVSFYTAFGQGAFLLISLLCAGLASRFPNTRGLNSLLFCAKAIAILLFIPLCFLPKLAVTPFFLLTLLVCALIYGSEALRLVFDYKQPHQVMDIGDYSSYTAISGIFVGVFGMLPGWILTKLFEQGDFYRTTALSFLIAALCLIGAGVLNRFLKLLHPIQISADAAKRGSARELFRHPQFRALFFPNLIRGMGAGVVGLVPMLALREAGFNEGNVNLITSFTYGATLASCALYGVLAKRKVPIPALALGGAVAFFALCPAFQGSVPLFLTLYAISYSGYNTICYAIPDMVYKSVDPTIISAFHTWRMALTTIGTILSAMLVGVLAKYISAFWLTLVGTACMFYCCWAYYRYYKKHPIVQNAEGTTNP